MRKVPPLWAIPFDYVCKYVLFIYFLGVNERANVASFSGFVVSALVAIDMYTQKNT